MIAAWMAYWLGASTLLAIAVMAADRVRQLARRPLRWVWAIGITLCMFAPFLAGAAHRVWRAASTSVLAVEPHVTSGVPRTPAMAAVPAHVGVVRTPPAAPPALAAWNTPLLAAWGMASAIIATTLLSAVLRLRSLRRSWHPATVQGHRVLISPAVGPAVAGFMRPTIVIPEWALAAPALQQRLMLLHEREHVRGHDPALLLAALLALVVMPWNLVLWWLAHRLRLAVELDCDARVLREMPDIATYGALLIEVGRRKSSRHVVPVAALSDCPTLLQKRISMMTLRQPRHSLVTAVVVVGLSAIPAGAATIVPQPVVSRPAFHMPWLGRAAHLDSVAPGALRAMKVSIRNLMVSQEAYFHNNKRYAPDVATLAADGYKPEAGVTTRLSWASANAYVLEAMNESAPGASCIVNVGWIPRSAWPATALEKETALSGTIACDGDDRRIHARWVDQVRQFMATGLEALVLPQERARGATGTYPHDAARLPSNHLDPALHFSYLWADTASWAAKAVYDSIPGKSCVVWEGSRPWSGAPHRQHAMTDGQHRMEMRGKVACDDF